VLPFVQSWHADSTVCGRAGDSNNIETFLHGLERLVCKKALTGNTGIFIECLHFLRGVSFCEDSYINAFVGISIL
jgi:hypothetical protein